MAEDEATRFPIDSATQIHILTLLVSAQAGVESLAIGLEMVARAAYQVPAWQQFSADADALSESVADLHERIRAVLVLGEAN